MPRLAIVISVVGGLETLEATLVSVLENRPADCEIVVALNRPYSDPYDLAAEVRFVQAGPKATAVGCINQVLAEVRAPFVHLLASGCHATEGWTEQALARFGDRRVASVAPLLVDAEQPTRIVAAGLGYSLGGRRLLQGRGKTDVQADVVDAMVGPSGLAAFYRKASLDLVHGLSLQLGMEQADVDVALALRRAGFLTAFEPQSRLLVDKACVQPLSAFQRAIAEERLFWRNISTDQRAKALVAHAAVVSRELLGSIPRPRLFTQLAGRLIALCQARSHARHRQELDQLSQRGPARQKVALEHLRVDRPHARPAPAEATNARARSV